MAITAITPVTASVIEPGDSFSFTIDNTYTVLQVEVDTQSGVEYAYDESLGGAQAGYTVVVTPSGGQNIFTVSRNAGWDTSPQTIRVIEDEAGGAPATTALSWFLSTTSIYPEGYRPYNAVTEGTLLVTEDDVSISQIVGQLDFDDASFNVSDLGNGKVRIVGITSGSALTVEDEGTPLSTNVMKINFVGAGVTATEPVTDEIDVTITSGVTDHGALTGLSDDDHTIYYISTGIRTAECAYLAERADHVNTPGILQGEVWLRNDALQQLVFTDEAGTDYELQDTSGTRDQAATYFAERADHVNTPAATFGELWVRNDTPNVLVFTDDAGTDTVLGSGGGGGDVTAAANLGDNLLIRGDGAVKGVQNSGITVSDTDDLSGIGNITLTGTVDGVDVSARDHDAVTLAGTPNYITISGQILTRNQIDLTTDVTGLLPTGNIADEAVTLAKIQHIATDSFLGRDTAATGDVEVLSAATARTVLNVADGATNTPLTGTAPVDVTKAAAVVGVSTEAARQDHKHDVSTATAGAATPGDAATEGVATSLARSDHQHSLPAFGSGAGTFAEGNDARLSDDRTASGIRTATTIVAVSASAAPGIGDVLTATSGTAATWQAPASGGGQTNTVTGGVGITNSGNNIDATLDHDAHTGEVTGSTALTIANNAVTNAKAADMAANTVKVRNAATLGDPADLAVGTNTVIGRVAGNIVAAQLVNGQITNATIANAKFATMAANTVKANATAGAASPTDVAIGTNTVLGRVAGNIVAAQVATGQIANNAVDNTKAADMAGFSVKAKPTTGTGDPSDLAVGTNTVVGRVAGDVVAAQLVGGQVADNAITYAKIQDVSATSRFLGRITAGAGDTEELTGTQATTLLDAFTSGLKGLAPASGGGTTNFLRADGSWVAPAGGGDVTGGSASAVDEISVYTDTSGKAIGRSSVKIDSGSAATGTRTLSGNASVSGGYIGTGGTIAATSTGAIALGGTDQTAGTATLQATNLGSIAFGLALTSTGATSATVQATSLGSCVIGYANATSATTSLLSAAGIGSFVQGRCEAGGIVETTTLGAGAFVQGRSQSGGIIRGSGSGAMAQGAVTGSGANLIASGNGSFSHGFASGAGATITASGDGSVAIGQASAGGDISVTQTGSLGGGNATVNTITSSGSGSFAWGDCTSGAITASATNSVQFGVGVNAEAESLQVGDTTDGVRINANGAPGTPHNGDIWVGTTFVRIRSNGENVPINPERSKSITVESPTASEDISIFFTNRAITVTEMRAVVRGTTPSVTWTIRHGTDRSAAGAEVVTSGTTTTSQTTGSDVTTFNDATIVADSFVWLETTAATGTNDELHITIFYTTD